ncbi:hypothetical protein N9L68_06110 [bacterium]|nr:hypothetical protein [bacterium]
MRRVTMRHTTGTQTSGTYRTNLTPLREEEEDAQAASTSHEVHAALVPSGLRATPQGWRPQAQHCIRWSQAHTLWAKRIGHDCARNCLGRLLARVE